MNKELVEYIEAEIFPRYERFYSHGLDHIQRVIETAQMLGETYGLDKDILYAAAACHDLGLKVNRKHHEEESGKIVAADERLPEFFSADALKLIKEAVEDHRGSRKERPRSMYGCVISDADRDFDVATLARRNLATSIRNYLDVTTFEGHFERCYEYLMQRVKGEHFNLWTEHPELVRQREEYEKTFFDKERTREIYRQAWEMMESKGIIEKILNGYYEDF